MSFKIPQVKMSALLFTSVLASIEVVAPSAASAAYCASMDPCGWLREYESMLTFDSRGPTYIGSTNQSHMYEWFCHSFLRDSGEPWTGSSGTCEDPKTIPIASDLNTNPTRQCGSVISVEDQVLGEVISLVGVPAALVYSSDRVVGRTAQFEKEIPLLATNPDTDISTATVLISHYGTVIHTENFTAGVPSSYLYSWNGNDAYSNYVGAAKLMVKVIQSYATEGKGSASAFYPIYLGVHPDADQGLGKWSLSVVHFYDPVSKILYKGDGSKKQISAREVSPELRIPNDDASEVYMFNSAGRHLRTVDGLTGATKLTFAYTAAGKISSITDSFGNATFVQRNSSGIATSITGPYGQITNLLIDSSGNLTQVTDPGSRSYEMTYVSAGGLLASFKKPGGRIGNFSYDSKGRLVSDSNNSGFGVTLAKATALDWTSAVTETFTRTSSMGRVTTSVSKQEGGYNTKTVTAPDGTSYASISTANFEGYQGAASSFTRTDSVSTYSVSSAPDIRFQDQVAAPSSIAYSNGFGRNEAYTYSSNPVSLATPFSFTSLQTTANINGFNHTKVYTKSTGVTLYTSSVGRTRTVKTNSVGQITETRQASFSPVLYTYDSFGRLASVAQGARITSLAYDSLGRLQTSTNPANEVVQWAYNSSGDPVSVTLPDSRVVGRTFNADGAVTSVTPPGAQVSSFTVNLNSEMTAFHPPALTGPTVTTTNYSYNNDGQLNQISRPSGALITYNFNSTTGRLEGISSGNSSSTIGYDWVGRPISSTSFDGISSSLGYSGTLVNFQSWDSHPNQYVQFGYNEYFRLSYFGVSSGTVYNLLYDNDGLLKKTGNENINRSSTTGLISDTVISNAREYYTYDSTYGELASYQAKYTTSTNKFLESYTRDALGRIAIRTVTIGTLPADVYGYTYDPAGRLTAVTKNSATIGSYTYDSNSNRTSTTNAAGTFAATYDAQDRLLTYGTKSFSYNLNGERISQTNSATNPGTTSYTWDVFGQLKQVTLPAGTQIKYLYDAQGRRVTKMTGTTVNERYVWLDQLRPLGVLNNAGSTVMTFFYGDRHTPEYMIKSGTTYKFFVDHVGSVRMVMNASTGVVAQEITYDEFGRILSDSSPGFQPFGFAGGLYDSSTKLVQFGARWYDAEVGRWLSKDPIGFAGGDTNLYGYVLQDPINFFDPTGKDIWVEGPSGAEPLAHQSICVGNPAGVNQCFSFGANGHGLQGEVYIDNAGGGAIESYKTTTAAQDASFLSMLNGEVGNTGTYGYDDICRSYSQRKFSQAPGMTSSVPSSYRNRRQRGNPWGISSTTGTGTSR